MVAAAILTKGKNIKPANFAEHIDFKPAQTMEEAVAYAKKNLGVEKFDFGNDVEMANWVNEGLTNISNRFKGKANMPKELYWADKVVFEELARDKGGKFVVGAYCQGDILGFNKEYFSKELTKDVKNAFDLIYKPSEKAGAYKKVTLLGEDFAIRQKLDEYFAKLINKPEEFSRFDAISAKRLLQDYMSSYEFAQNNPTYFLNVASKNEKIKTLLENKGIDLSLENFKKLPKEKQKEFMENFFKVSNANKIRYVGYGGRSGNSKFDILYHEMGHLLHHKNVSHADEFWGRLSRKSEKAFLADNAKLETAGKISWYAQTAPCEFVAETFNALCAGKKLPDDVMEMYRYYKGPELPNM